MQTEDPDISRMNEIHPEYVDAVDRAVSAPAIASLIAEGGLDPEAIRDGALAELALAPPPDEEVFSDDVSPPDPGRSFAARLVLWVERSVFRIGGGTALAVVAILLADSAGLISVPAVSVLVFTIGLGAGLGFVGSRAGLLRDVEGRTARSREALERRRSAAREDIREGATHAVRERVNRTLERRFSRLLRPVDTDGLADMSASEYDIPTSAASRLERHLSAIRAGAIGVAGPRGAGKTTVIRAACDGRLRADSETPSGARARGVLVSAPVRYEARDFVVYLLARVCLDVVGHAEASERYRRALLDRRRVWFQIAAALSAAAAGTVAVLQWLARGEASASPALLAVIAATVVWLFASQAASVGRPRLARPAAGSLAELRQEARDILQELRFQETVTRERSAEIGGRMLLKAGGKSARALATQAPTLPQLIDQYHGFTGRLAERGPLIIGIDELDKMASLGDAERFLNDIKTLFAGRVYYLVSISDDAMSAFERRGLPLRDVFESTFDDVLRVEPLNIDEAERLLQRRAAPISPPFPDLCHVLAGGLPRELIRAARQAVAVARHGDPSLDNVARSLILDRDAARLRAAEAIARVHVARDGGQPLLSWLRALPPITTPASLFERCGVTPVVRQVRANVAAEEAQRELELLLCELAAQWYHSGTTWEFFTGLTESRWRTGRRAMSTGTVIDVLAQAQLDLGASPRLAWDTVSRFREHVGLEARDYPVVADS